MVSNLKREGSFSSSDQTRSSPCRYAVFKLAADAAESTRSSKIRADETTVVLKELGR
jgi:hypothetical protein